MIQLLKCCAGCVIAIMLAGSTAAQPNLNRVEYYLDTDPGYGNGIAVSFSPGTNLSDVVLSIDPGTISSGVHVLGIRARNANGAWSQDNRWLFAKPYAASGSAPGPVPNLVRIEYYLDSDPGYGNATSVGFAAAKNVADVAIPLDPATLKSGVHVLGIRAKDANGAWSQDNRWLFAKPYPDALVSNPTANLSEVEYYIDTDPGYGKGVPVAINPVNNLPDFSLPINISGLTSGTHKFLIRSKDANGKWGHDNFFNFTVSSSVAAPSIVVNSVTDTVHCARDSFDISYDATGTYNAGNVFNVQLSDENGSFAGTPAVVGSYAGITNSIVRVKLPSHLPEGSNYRLRVVSTNPVVTGIAGYNTLTIHDRPIAQTITGDANVNQGYSYPYSVPTATGSTWAWIAPAATITQTANSASLLWNTVGQPQSIKIVETNQYGCVGDTSSKNVNVYPLKITEVTPSSLQPCPAESITVAAKASGVYYTGNVFTAQLSNATGSFATPVVIGTLTPATQPIGNDQPIILNATLPFPLANGTNYRIRVISSNYVKTGDTSAAITINKPNLGADISRSKCVGYTYNLTQDYTDATLTYTYFTQAFGALAAPTGVDVGVYQVIGTNSIGCKDTAQVTITNYPKPDLGADKTISKCPIETVNLPSLFTTTGLTSEWDVATPASVQTPGTYRLIVTNSNGCKDTAFVTVSNYPKPDIGADKTISKCPIETVDLTALYTTTGLTSVWDVATPASVQTPGTYRLIVTNTNGCKDTAFVTVSNYPKPDIGADKTISKCPIETVDLTALYNTTGLTSVWDVATPASVQTPGTYRLIVTNSNGCKDTAFVTVTNYPKPNLGADKSITISCAGGTADITTLYNTTGFTVAYNTASPATATVGQYEIIVTNTNGCKDTAQISVLDAPVTTVPAQPSLTKMASRECTDGNGWTHYYNDNGTPADYSDDIRLLSLKKNGQNIGTPGNGTFQVMVGTTAKAGSGHASLVVNNLIPAYYDFYSMNRYWKVNPTQQPSNPIDVRFYYNSQDLLDVNGDYPSHDVNHSSLQMFKTDGGTPDPSTNWSGATAVHFYQNGSVANTNTWVYSSLGNNVHQAQFVVTSFSGGGAGASAIQTLPITLVQFNAIAELGKVKLDWRTATEINTKAFVLQRSTDGRIFGNIGMVAAAGNSTVVRNYTFVDADVIRYSGQTIYYRLLQTDLNGQQKFSDVRSVKIGKPGNQLTLQFNPVRSDAVLNYSSTSVGKATLRVSDAAGRIIVVRQVSLSSGSNQFRLSSSTLAQGIYTVELLTQTESHVVRMVKE